jgi:hypothetical protein
MRIKIVLEDTDSGHVKLETTPDTTKIVKIAQGERDKVTPALAYAMKALSSIMQDSVKQGQAEGIIPQGSVRSLWTPKKKNGSL